MVSLWGLRTHSPLTSGTGSWGLQELGQASWLLWRQQELSSPLDRNLLLLPQGCAGTLLSRTPQRRSRGLPWAGVP